MIKASLVKELRDKTGAGMMDCKKALTETKGNVEEAIAWLREHGILKAQKKAHRIAAEGICSYAFNNDKAVLFEINSETDFVAKTKEFQDLVSKIGDALLVSDAVDVESALNVKVDDGSVNDLLVNATATIGENIVLRRFASLSKEENQVFGTYSHMGGKIAVVSVINGNDEEAARDVSMHVAAMNPLYLNRDAIDADVLAKEKEILTQETINEGKPEKIIDRIVTGKLEKYFKTNTLVEQDFVKNQDQTIGEFLKSKNSEVVNYLRFEVGEGQEKREDDFAAEVMEAAGL